MKIKLHEASKQLDMHPLNLLLKIYPLVGNLDDCYPELDEGLVETSKRMGAQHQQDSVGYVSTPSAPAKTVEPTPYAELSAGARKVIEKLWRKDLWGGKGIARASLNHLCRNVSDLEDVLKVLIDKELVLTQDKDGPFSLNTRLKNSIEAVARQSVEQQRRYGSRS